MHRNVARYTQRMVVWYSLVGSNAKAMPNDIMDPRPRRAPTKGIPRTARQIHGPALEPTLRQAGLKTVIVRGNAVQGATVGTALGAARRGPRAWGGLSTTTIRGV
jgi:hypothetical protein